MSLARGDRGYTHPWTREEGTWERDDRDSPTTIFRSCEERVLFPEDQIALSGPTTVSIGSQEDEVWGFRDTHWGSLRHPTVGDHMSSRPSHSRYHGVGSAGPSLGAIGSMDTSFVRSTSRLGLFLGGPKQSFVLVIFYGCGVSGTL